MVESNELLNSSTSTTHEFITSCSVGYPNPSKRLYVIYQLSLVGYLVKSSKFLKPVKPLTVKGECRVLISDEKSYRIRFNKFDLGNSIII